MWSRLMPPAPNATDLPTPLTTGNVRRRSIREQLLDDDEDDVRPPPCKKRAHFPIRSLLDKCKQRGSNNDGVTFVPGGNKRHVQTGISVSPDSSTLEKLQREVLCPFLAIHILIYCFTGSYAALRVTLHSHGLKDVAKAGSLLAVEADERLNSNLAKLHKIISEERQVSAACLDAEVDSQIKNQHGQMRSQTVQIRSELSKFRDLESERCRQLSQLWISWERTQSDINKLSKTLHALLDHDTSRLTRGIFSNVECSEKEDRDIDRCSKQALDEMAACEDEFHEKLKGQEAHILEAMLNFSLG
ncbi:hypothetical protein F4808DRAFT_459413 [Astrocystis sublimbata]|nr:hypothetical protein F4808DRAFT_459413 [Astrocystis sublimbata]